MTTRRRKLRINPIDKPKAAAALRRLRAEIETLNQILESERPMLSSDEAIVTQHVDGMLQAVGAGEMSIGEARDEVAEINRALLAGTLGITESGVVVPEEESALTAPAAPAVAPAAPANDDRFDTDLLAEIVNRADMRAAHELGHHIRWDTPQRWNDESEFPVAGGRFWTQHGACINCNDPITVTWPQNIIEGAAVERTCPGTPRHIVDPNAMSAAELAEHLESLGWTVTYGERGGISLHGEKNGVTISLQAGRDNYSDPRRDGFTYYTEIEVAAWRGERPNGDPNWLHTSLHAGDDVVGYVSKANVMRFIDEVTVLAGVVDRHPPWSDARDDEELVEAINEVWARTTQITKQELEELVAEGHNLRGVKLVGMNLREANLHGAMLRGADLSGCDLAYAKLRAADLAGANLTDAYVNHADFFLARLGLENHPGARAAREWYLAHRLDTTPWFKTTRYTLSGIGVVQGWIAGVGVGGGGADFLPVYTFTFGAPPQIHPMDDAALVNQGEAFHTFIEENW